MKMAFFKGDYILFTAKFILTGCPTIVRNTQVQSSDNVRVTRLKESSYLTSRRKILRRDRRANTHPPRQDNSTVHEGSPPRASNLSSWRAFLFARHSIDLLLAWIYSRDDDMCFTAEGEPEGSEHIYD